MAFAAAVKTSALNWPHHRGTATAFPLAAFGLSAFFFSLIGSIIFPGDPSDFLMLLAVGTCGMTFVGFFFLKVHSHSPSHYSPVPGPVEQEQEQELEHEQDHDHDRGYDQEHSMHSSGQLHRTHSMEANFRHSNPDLEPGTSDNSPMVSTMHAAETAVTSSDDCNVDETSSLVSIASEAHAVGNSTSVDVDGSHRVDIRGLDLLRSHDFWQLFFIMAILAGIGLMTIKYAKNPSPLHHFIQYHHVCPPDPSRSIPYSPIYAILSINSQTAFVRTTYQHWTSNIGNNAKALWEKYDENVSQDFLVLRQQMHVSILSVCSFLGRLGSGKFQSLSVELSPFSASRSSFSNARQVLAPIGLPGICTPAACGVLCSQLSSSSSPRSALS